jgi:hypothetical protein
MRGLAVIPEADDDGDPELTLTPTQTEFGNAPEGSGWFVRTSKRRSSFVRPMNSARLSSGVTLTPSMVARNRTLPSRHRHRIL